MKLFKILILVPLMMSSSFSWAETAEDLVFIVNTKNPVTEVSVTDIRDYYFKRKKQWPNGESVRFIDRNATSRIRDIFLKNILRKTNSDVELFWIGQKLYSGDSAPLREPSDNATVLFVSSFEGGIGYVSAEAAALAKNVKVIKTASLSED